MLSLTPMIPPAMPSAESLNTALTILAVAADPQKTKSRLAELTDQLGVVRAAYDELAAERESVEAEQAKLSDLLAAQAKLAADQAAAAESASQLAVATSAVSGREQAAREWEAKLTKRENDLAAREKTLAARVASYRQALGA